MTTPLSHSPPPAAAPPELRCPRCALPLDPAATECAVCRSGLRIAVFPAYRRPPAAISTASGERAIEGEAACFFHAEKRATVACERCGRFLCALCDLPLAGRHLCPLCLDASKLPELVPSRWVGAELAAWLGVGPLVFALPLWPLLPFTALSAIFVALWTWRKPGSLVRGPRHGLAVLGLLGALGQMAICAGLVLSIVYAIRRD